MIPAPRKNVLQNDLSFIFFVNEPIGKTDVLF